MVWKTHHGMASLDRSCKLGSGGDFTPVWRIRHWFYPYRFQIGLALLALVLSSACAVIQPILLAYVVIDNVLMNHEISKISINLWLLDICRWISINLSISMLAAAGVSMMLLMLVFVVSAHFYRTQLMTAALNGLCDLRCDLFEHLEKLPAAFFDRNEIGTIATHINQDIELLAQLVFGVSSVAGAIVPLFLAISVIWSLDISLAAELTPFVVLVVGLTAGFLGIIGPLYKRILQIATLQSGHLYENLSAIETVQLNNRQEFDYRRFTTSLASRSLLEEKAFKVETTYFSFLDSLWGVALAVILWSGGHKVFALQLSLGSLILFLQYSEMLFRPLVELGLQVNGLLRARVSCERIFKLLDWDEALKVPDSPVALGKIVPGKIECKGLEFCYSPGILALAGVSLAIESKQHVAIIGPTGSGKTTLSRLICRFYDIPEGMIFIDGVDIMRISPGELRQHIGVIFQDFHIFPGTILENIALGNSRIDLDTAMRAAEAVQARRFIEALPRGFHTFIDDKASGLSQGEKQLLAFARVVAHNPDVLILDEATSNIDSETEAAIQIGLRSVMQDRTTITIAHRLHTIRDSDQIFVMNEGRLVEQGTHHQLLLRGGMYATLYAQQTVNGELL